MDLADRAKQALTAIADPAGGGDIVATGRVEAVLARGDRVQATLRIGPNERERGTALTEAVEAALRRTDGIGAATVVLTAHRGAAPPASNAAPAPTPGPAGAKAPRPKLLAEIRHVVAVASGKGGVGKSTVATNLAIGLAQLGLRVGLLDADIHGPSVPRMLGAGGKPDVRGDRMQPIRAWNIDLMSMGFLVPEHQAMIWRGPMVMGALEQLMGQVDWPPLDVMVIDMPPGTGDAQLTLSQRVSLRGAVIVSTPQDIALVDARRGIDMFGRTGVPILGVVENMSVFCCPNCGHRSAVFGEGGAEREATKLGVPFLGAVPLELAVRRAGDEGTPVVLAAPDTQAAEAFRAIATRLAEIL